MAIDSQTKRMAALGVARPYMRATLANLVNAAQRSSIANSYPVAEFSAPAAPTTTNRINRGDVRAINRSICRDHTDA